MIEEAYCPQCDAELGLKSGGIPIGCWKCGLAFGQTASTKPLIREKDSGGRYSPLRVATAVFAPALVYVAVILIYRRMPFPSLGRLFMIPAAGLAIFGGGCVLYMIGWAAQADRGGLWIVKAAMCSTMIILDTILFIMAVMVIGR